MMAKCSKLVVSYFFISWIFISRFLTIIQAKEDTNQIVYTDEKSDFCDTEVELGSATVYSHNPINSNYPHDQNCGVTFIAKKKNWRLKIDFEYIDMTDVLYNGAVCADALYISDSKKRMDRPIELAGGVGGLCGSTPPSVITSTGRYISIYFSTDVSGESGKGFKFQITAFTDELDEVACSQSNFYCKSTERCIESDFVCDRIKQCTNGDDEENDGTSMCNPTEKTGLLHFIDSMGVAGFIGIIVGSVVVLILLIVCIVCTFRRCGKQPGDTEHRQSIPSSTHGSVGASQQQPHMVKDGVAYQAVPQGGPNVQMNAYLAQNALNNQMGSGPGYINSTGQQYPQQQRPSYVAPQHMMEMQMVPMAHNHEMGVAHPQPAPVVGPGLYNYNAPFQVARGGESLSYSSGYSSQQGPSGGASGFQPMHTKPIIAQRGYTPTSGSSRSSRSRSENSITYPRGDNHQQSRREHGRQRSQPAVGL